MRRGADYIAGIRQDGRTILVDGARVEDVTTHPGFAGPTRVIARLYGAAIRKAGIDGSTPLVCCSASIWLVILNR